MIVVPKCKRPDILRLAHYKLGHLGYKKVVAVIRRSFVWSRLTLDVKAYCTSCVECQKGNKVGHHRAPIIECPVISKPFRWH